MKITSNFISKEIETQDYEISLHADDERIAEGLTTYQVEYALLKCKIIEEYPDDLRGESCLAVGFSAEGIPIHVVCGKNPSGNLIWITIYIPTMPKWRDPFTRNK